MKIFVLAVCVGLVGLIEAGRLARAVAPSASSDKDAQVLRSELDVKLDGYQFLYETNNGISGQATGTLKKTPEGDAVVVQGQYQYTAPDGSPVQVNYDADETGYHPTGAHLPTPHPIPEYIARSLEYIAAHPPPVEKRL